MGSGEIENGATAQGLNDVMEKERRGEREKRREGERQKLKDKRYDD